MEIAEIKSRVPKSTEISYPVIMCVNGEYNNVYNMQDLELGTIILNTKKEVLTFTDWAVKREKEINNMVYSFNHALNLLTGCNITLLQMLGHNKNDYIALSQVGDTLVSNRCMFLSKEAETSFLCYVANQLKLIDLNIERGTDCRIDNARLMEKTVTAYYMFFDMAEKLQVRTSRDRERDIIDKISNYGMMDELGRPNNEFYELKNELDRQLRYTLKHSILPEKPDKEAIDELRMEVNESVVKGTLR